MRIQRAFTSLAVSVAVLTSLGCGSSDDRAISVKGTAAPATTTAPPTTESPSTTDAGFEIPDEVDTSDEAGEAFVVAFMSLLEQPANNEARQRLIDDWSTPDPDQGRYLGALAGGWCTATAMTGDVQDGLAAIEEVDDTFAMGLDYDLFIEMKLAVVDAAVADGSICPALAGVWADAF